MEPNGLKEQRDAKLARIQELASKDVAGGEGLTDDEAREFDTLEAEVKTLNGRIERFNRVAGLETPDLRSVLPTTEAEPGSPEQRKAPAGGSVKVDEAPVYRKGGKESFFRDLRNWSTNGDVEARERISNYHRVHAKEYEERALTSTDANGGYLVPPLWAMDEFVELRAKTAVAASVVKNVPLPPGTDQINMPTMDGATAVALSTENSALQETSATFSKVTADVFRVGGQQKIPNTLLDRGVAGAMIDQIVLADLAKRLAIKLDQFVLAGAGTTEPTGLTVQGSIGGSTYTAATATPQGLHAAILGAVSDVVTGFFEYPDAILMHPRRWAWLLGQTDGASATGRAWVPEIGPQNTVGSSTHSAHGYGGVYAGIPVYLDANISVLGGSGTDEDYILVLASQESYLFNGVPRFEASRDAAFSSDQTVVRAVQDVAFTAGRYPASISMVSGTGLNDTL